MCLEMGIADVLINGWRIALFQCNHCEMPVHRHGPNLVCSRKASQKAPQEQQHHIPVLLLGLGMTQE